MVLFPPRVPCVEAPAGRSGWEAAELPRTSAVAAPGTGLVLQTRQARVPGAFGGSWQRSGRWVVPRTEANTRNYPPTGQMERFAGRGWIARGRERRHSSPLCFQRKRSPRGGAVFPASCCRLQTVVPCWPANGAECPVLSLGAVGRAGSVRSGQGTRSPGGGGAGKGSGPVSWGAGGAHCRDVREPPLARGQGQQSLSRSAPGARLRGLGSGGRPGC